MLNHTKFKESVMHRKYSAVSYTVEKKLTPMLKLPIEGTKFPDNKYSSRDQYTL